ncbi:hypothetical protein Taro_040219 [Colocasia esculenta]|uniref:Uncharacterized protein n=1 Tax=Colocasia esculenta TaxID=4460 RepID=A0A843WTV4_COLES|nr:hypothetical protein [Colocasia esculenta]
MHRGSCPNSEDPSASTEEPDLKRSSWQLGEHEIPTPCRSSSRSRLLRPAQTVHLKSTKGDYEVQEEDQVEDENASE